MSVANCRCAVPRQSAPVSPPPMITTCLFSAVMVSCGENSCPLSRRFCCVRYFIANSMPFRFLPWMGRSLGIVDPPASIIAWFFSSSSFGDMSIPTLVLVRNLMPSSRICCIRLSTTVFSSLNSGIPSASSPPRYSSRSNTVTLCPDRFSCCAAASPAGPEPTTAMFLFVR